MLPFTYFIFSIFSRMYKLNIGKLQQTERGYIVTQLDKFLIPNSCPSICWKMKNKFAFKKRNVHPSILIIAWRYITCKSVLPTATINESSGCQTRWFGTCKRVSDIAYWGYNNWRDLKMKSYKQKSENLNIKINLKEIEQINNRCVFFTKPSDGFWKEGNIRAKQSRSNPEERIWITEPIWLDRAYATLCNLHACSNVTSVKICMAKWFWSFTMYDTAMSTCQHRSTLSLIHCLYLN